MAVEILRWQDVKDGFNGAIILGNGASVAVDDRFNYKSLKEYASEVGFIPQDVQSIFDFFETDDFELILRIVWQATNVNKSLRIEDKRTEQAYKHIRDCLIATIRIVHPPHADVSGYLPNIYNFLKGFDTVISLNYDLIVYWVMMHGRDINDHHAFKDCFISSKFDDVWRRFREPIKGETNCTLVFHPHGNLILARDKIEDESKISTGQSPLLDEIFRKWSAGSYVPLFVSEGTSNQKLKSIQSSHYLNIVYREVLTDLPDNLVIYGWKIGEHDIHILERVAKSAISRIAISVLDGDQDYCARVQKTLKDKVANNVDIRFFDCKSNGCWNLA